MARQKDEPKILLDADVVIHFIKAGYHLKLARIFPGRLILLDKVKHELLKRKSERQVIENFFNWTKISIEPFPKDIKILKEYATLIKSRGKGESACMTVARFKKEYIASSNLRDIQEYCKRHDITYYTTMDLLEIAIEKKVMSESECNTFIKEVKEKGSKLPCLSIAEYRALRKDSITIVNEPSFLYSLPEFP